MKILFVSESIWMAGVVYDLHMLAEGLSLLGHEVYAIDQGTQTEDARTNIPEDEIKKVSRAFPGACVQLMSPHIPKPVLGNLSMDRYHVVQCINRYNWLYKKIDEFLKNVKVDIIVLYSAVRLGRQAALLARKHRIPIVFRNVDMLHKLWPTPAERFVAKLMEKNVYPQMDRLFALTPKYADYLVKLGADRKKIDLLLFPIDMDIFKSSVDCSDIRQKWGLKREDKVIVFMGTLYKFGGIAEFAHRFPLILKQIPRAKLLIVGDGPLRPRLEQAMGELNVNGNIIITGYQPFDLMPKYISAATICLNAFPINDTTEDLFSAKIVQYLSCRKSTVSSSLPGITTVIPGESAGVVYADTMDDLAKEVVDLIKSPRKREKLEESGQNYVRQFHSHTTVIDRIEGLLKETIEDYEQ